MKYVIIIVFLVSLFSVSALTKETVLVPNQSFNFSDKNVTLIAIGEDNIVVCVNNKKEIISDTKAMNGVNIDLAWVRTKDAKLNLKFADCKDCDYGNWDNLDCFDECVNDNDCNDNNDNTKDTCSGRPKKCVHENIAKKMIAENKTKEENKTVEFVETTEPKKIEYKSFTQWIFEKIKNLFNK